MSLLSALLDHMPPAIAGADAAKVWSRPPARMALVNRVERFAQFDTASHASATTATPEWRQARDQYLNHIMICCSCHAPTDRHCAAGAHLRASYDNTPMEAHR